MSGSDLIATPVDAPPQTWSSGPGIEYRAQGGKAAWIDQSGRPSDKVDLKSANLLTGARCAR